MSAHSSTAPAHDHGHDEDKFHIYVQIAMLLAVITGVEIVVIYLPFPKALVITVLALLSVVKFLYVIFYFMHLRWDKPFCTILFFMGLIIGGGTLWALLEIFSAHDSKPLEVTMDAAPIAHVSSLV